MEFDIRPVFVYDGEPPEFKKKTIEERKTVREEAKKKWDLAVKEGRKEDIMVYAQGALKLTDEMMNESKELLDAMGVPWTDAASEGESQCAFMCRHGDVDYAASQDYDALLFSSPKLVRNLSITGKRKLPRQEAYIEIKPEVIYLDQVLSSLEITQEQLVILGILIGTDYNPGGVKGVGPKTALKIIKEHKTLDNVLKNVEYNSDVDAYKIYDFFLNAPVFKKYTVEWKEPDKDKIMELMIKEHDFSEERISNAIDKIIGRKKGGTQLRLESWFKK
jgi:flap endonuclease-1